MADGIVITPMDVDEIKAPSPSTKTTKKEDSQLPWVEKYRPQR